MRYIVTLTSYGHRLKNTTPYAICSLLNQTEAPDMIILWLAYNTPVPSILKRFCDIGLEIKFCKDLKSYKKLIPALLEFPDDVLVTADDDVFYPNNWFEQLKTAFLKDSSKIYLHRTHRMLFDNEGKLASYKDWIFCTNPNNDEAFSFPTGVGGILYPPQSLHPICSDEDIFLSLAPTADDIWFWAMAKLNGTKYSTIQDGYHNIKSIDLADKGLWYTNKKGANDIQLKKVIDRFPIIMDGLLKAKRSFEQKLAKVGNPAISVVMPCFNCDKYVGNAIMSILCQVFTNFEFIIVNDGSTDNSDSEIRRYLSDNRIRYIVLDENKGNYPARNIGLKLAKGKYIAVMDADDVAEQGRLLLQYEYMEAHKSVGCVGGQAYSIDGDGVIIGYVNMPEDYNFLELMLLKNNYTIHPSLMFRKSLMQKYNLLYNENLTYAADYDFVVKLLKYSKIINIPDRLIRYRHHNGQISVKEPTQKQSFTGSVRLYQLKRFNIALSKKDVDLYQKIMAGERISDGEVELCSKIFKRVLESNRIVKLFRHNHLLKFFNSIIDEYTGTN